MKNLVSGFLLLVSVTAYAQEKTKKLYVGPKINMNVAYLKDRYAQLSGAQGYGYENHIRTSLGIGVCAEYFQSNVASFQTALLYVPKGGCFRKENGSVIYLSNQGAESAYYYRYYQLNYLEVPLLVKLTLNASQFQAEHSEAPRFQMMFGPSFSFNTRSAIRSNEFHTGSGYGLVDVNQSWNQEPYDYAKNTVPNLIFGLELQYPTDFRRTVFFDLRLTQSIGSVYRSTYGSRTKISNTTYSLGGGIKF